MKKRVDKNVSIAQQKTLLKQLTPLMVPVLLFLPVALAAGEWQLALGFLAFFSFLCGLPFIAICATNKASQPPLPVQKNYVSAPIAVESSKNTLVPRLAEYLLLLIPKKDRENLIGDLEEEFTTIVLPRHGKTKARLWYWWHTLISLLPYAVQFVKRIIGLRLILKLIGR